MITVTADQLHKAEALLKDIPDGVPRAMVNAINRAADMSRTEMVRIITRRYHVKAGDARSTMRIAHAGLQNPAALITSRGKALSARHFKVTGNPGRRLPKFPKSSTPVTLQVRRDSSPKAGKTMFGVKSSSGKLMLFTRDGAERLPISFVTGPAIPNMLGEKHTIQTVNERAQEILGRRLDHEIERLRKGIEGKRR